MLEFNNKKILLVDDDSTTRFMSRKISEQIGLQVLEAGSGESALEIFNDENPDIVLLDVDLPGMDGFNACKEMRFIPNGQNTPVVMLTSLDSIDSIENAYRVGATDFMIKPVNWMILGHRLRHIINAREVEKEIQHMAYYDSLTGLPNRVFFQKQIDLYVKRAKRDHTSFAVLFLDLDNFKGVNDTLGHDAGDKLLKIFANRLQQCLRDCDIVSHDHAEDVNGSMARLGGDEFIILIHDCSEEIHVVHIVQRIIRTMTQPVEFDHHELPLNVSIGIAMYPVDGKDTRTLLKHADLAMYHAKGQGHNHFCFYEEAMNVLAWKKLQLESDLRKAIREEQFFLVYQPKVDLKDGKVHGVEALVRWQHPVKGLVRPDEFISLAEEMNLISPIGDWVLKEACHKAKEWLDAGYDLKMAVNLSAQQFLDSDLVENVKLALESSGLSPEYLELELTEGMVMKNDVYTLKILSKLKSLGVQLAIDDFGTGYSSLRYLSQFPLDVIKIDRSFIMGLPENHKDGVIVNAAMTLAKGLALEVVAEGVETEEQLAFLQENGCDIIQGFLYSRPIDSEKLLEFVTSFKQ